MRHGIILPSLPPLADDVSVTVCASCRNRCCLFFRGKRRCLARNTDENHGTVQRFVGELRALPHPEHESYWRRQPGDDPDMPKCVEDIIEEAKRLQAKPCFEDPKDEAQVFAGYLVTQLGLDAEQCRDVLRDVWPEASAAIDEVLKEAS